MMNNTDKLLRAFIEAQGYEVKVAFNQRGYNFDIAVSMEANHLIPVSKDKHTDYKVTKKKSQVSFDVDSPEWNAIVTFVLNQADDIEHGIEGYGDLKPMLDYFNRNSNERTKG